MRVILLLLISNLLFGWSCKWTAPYYQRYALAYFDWTYPYQTFMAQGAMESHCRKSAISNDGHRSKGIGQVTWKWWKHYLTREHIKDLNTIDRQIQAQVAVNRYFYDRIKCKKLNFMFRAYNGGLLINKEIKRAKSCDVNLVELYCKRKTVHFSNGTSRNACDINIKYARDILKYAIKWYGYRPNKNWEYGLWGY